MDISFHNTSQIGWYPVKLNLAASEFEIKKTPIVFNNGIKFNLHECLFSCNDVSLNKKTGLFLTDLTQQSNFLNKKTNYEEIEILKKIVTPLADLDSKILTNKKIENEPWNRLLPAEKYTFTNDDNFILEFKDDYVMIQFEKNKEYLTWLKGTGQGNLIFFPKIYPTIDRQKFKYLLGEDSLILFQYDPYVKEIVLRDQMLIVNQIFGTMAYGLSSYPLEYKGPVDKNCVFKLISYKKPKEKNTDIKNSFLAKYKTDPFSIKQDLNLDETTKNTPYTQNYLGVFPFQNPTIQGNFANYNLYIHGLKNYQTPEYNYAFYAKNAEIQTGEYGLRRTYDKIFAGTNQTGGLNQVYLGYNSNTLKMEFPTDVDTPFHFSPTALRQKIEESSLTEDGALAGETPYVSDRLFIKLEDYSQKILNAPQPPSIKNSLKDITNNTWLCSWLHLSSNNQPVWLDRYYNSAYYTVNEALTSKVYKYEQKIEPELNYVYDIPSQVYLEPGALYRYYHVGKKTREDYLKYVDNINNDPHLPLGAKLLHVKNWNSDPIKDDSNYKNNGICYFNKSENFKNDYLILDGTNHVLFPAKSILLEQTKLTVALWVKVDNWNSINGNQIFGNYYDSGFGLINESSLTTPLITILDSNANRYHNINYRFGRINNFEISKKTPLTKNRIVKRLADYSFWIFDTGNKKAKKISVDDQVLKEFDILFIEEISQVEIDSKENIYIYDNVLKKYVKYDAYGEYVNDVNLAKNVSQIQIDLNDKLIPLYGTHSCIDNDNSIWQVIGGNLYKCEDSENIAFSKNFASIGTVHDIVCDADNYLWLSHGQDSISKIDIKNEKIVMSFRIGKKSSLPLNKCLDESNVKRKIHLLRAPVDSNTISCGLNNKTEDRLVLIDDEEKTLYQIDSNGNLLIKLDLLNLTKNNNAEISAIGDITGYDYIRKYKISTKKLAWKLKISDITNKNQKLYSLEYNIADLKKGWHHFALSFDSTEGTAESYLDANLIQKITFEPKKYQLAYDFRTSLLLGVQNIKNTNLNDIIQINDGYKFIGEVSDLRMYAKGLTKGIIEQIYFSSDFGSRDKTMIWNMSVGKRNYIEDVKNWYKLQLPGSKSKYYNINLYNLNLPDNIKVLIEDAVRKNLEKISPAQASLYKINWK
jgi:hypothetical protein